jgi:hypothetical protein
MHRSGKNHKNVDVISRDPHAVDNDVDDVNIGDCDAVKQYIPAESQGIN